MPFEWSEAEMAGRKVMDRMKKSSGVRGKRGMDVVFARSRRSGDRIAERLAGRGQRRSQQGVGEVLDGDVSIDGHARRDRRGLGQAHEDRFHPD